MKGFISIEAFIVLVVLVSSSVLGLGLINSIEDNPFEIHHALWKRSVSASVLAAAAGLNPGNSTFIVIDRIIGPGSAVYDYDLAGRKRFRLWVDGLDSSDNLSVLVGNYSHLIECNFTPPYEDYGNSMKNEWQQGLGDSFDMIEETCEIDLSGGSVSVTADSPVYVLCMEVV